MSEHVWIPTTTFLQACPCGSVRQAKADNDDDETAWAWQTLRPGLEPCPYASIVRKLDRILSTFVTEEDE